MGKNQSVAARQGQPPAAQRAVPSEPEKGLAEVFREVRERRLKDINYQLVEQYHVDALDRLGNYTNGEEEVVRIENVLDNRWFAMVQFETRLAYSGERGVRFVRFPKRYKVVKGEKKGPLQPLVTTTIVNGKVVYTREFAVAQLTGRRPWRTHTPRQYAMSGAEDSFLTHVLRRRDDTRAVGDLGGVHTLFCRKLSRLLAKPGVKLASWRIMHDPDETGNPASIAEDDTFCAGGVVHLLLVFEAPPEVERLLSDRKLQREEEDEPGGARDPVQIQLLTIPEAIRQAKDQHTLTGFMLLLRIAGAIDVGKIDAFLRPPQENK